MADDNTVHNSCLRQTHKVIRHITCKFTRGAQWQDKTPKCLPVVLPLNPDSKLMFTTRALPEPRSENQFLSTVNHFTE